VCVCYSLTFFNLSFEIWIFAYFSLIKVPEFSIFGYLAVGKVNSGPSISQ
jgi:hypothetical protein